jgi:flavin-dependent dehydrogenase
MDCRRGRLLIVGPPVGGAQRGRGEIAPVCIPAALRGSAVVQLYGNILGRWLYVTPVDANEVCVALVSRGPELPLGEALNRYFPPLRERLPYGSEGSRERGAATGNVRLRAVARGNVALIGDASGSVDAIAGEGICLSFRQAEVLAEAMARGDLSTYNRRHPWLALRPHLMARTMLQLDRGQWIQNWALSLLSSQPRIFRQLL